MAKRKAKRVRRELTRDEKRRVTDVRAEIEKELPDIMRRGRKYKHASETARHIIDELKQAREAQGLSLADLKEITGMTRETICALENNEFPNPTIATLVRYGDAVGMVIKIEPLK